MTLYLDVIWLLNFFIDLLLLILTAFVLKKETSKKRLFSGALFASMYMWFLFIPGLGFMLNPIVKTLYSAVIILIAFKCSRIRTFVQALLMFYFVNFAVGGGLTGLHYFFQVDQTFIQGTFATSGASFGSPVSWLFVVAGFPAVYYFSRRRFEAVESVKIKYDAMMDVTVKVQGVSIGLKGFVDSGNQLTDPLSHKPVMIIDMTEAADQFPDELKKLAETPPELLTDIPDSFKSSISIVPFRTVGTANRFLWTVRPESVTIHENGTEYNCSKVLLGLSHHPLGEKGEYECLIHPEMIQKRKQA